MDGSSRAPGRRTLTPAVLASALFTAACAVLAISYVAARGGLQMPIAATQGPVAVASAGATTGPAPSEPTTAPTQAPTSGPTPFVSPSPSPIVPPPTTAATVAPTTGTPTLDPNDPLLVLPGCPNLPGCFEYTIQRGDSLTAIASRYLLPVSTVLALNPEITDPSIVVVGRILYLGRDPFVRLAPCPDVPDCSLYTVQPGDGLSTIAGRFGITTQAILSANRQITDPNSIFSGEVIHLPHPAA